jgi:peptidoglycan hydrolase-like protein with peptidoglycan-binding domain
MTRTTRITTTLTVLAFAASLLIPPAWGAVSPTDIRLMQTCLNRLGFQAGPVDGVLGAETVVAAARYAQSRGIPVTDSNRLGTELALDCFANAAAKPQRSPRLYQR